MLPEQYSHSFLNSITNPVWVIRPVTSFLWAVCLCVCMCVCVCARARTRACAHMHTYLVARSCTTVCDPMDCSPSGSSVHGIFHARILEWVAIASSRGSPWPRGWTQNISCISCITSLYDCATWEAPWFWVFLSIKLNSFQSFLPKSDNISIFVTGYQNGDLIISEELFRLKGLRAEKSQLRIEFVFAFLLQ